MEASFEKALRSSNFTKSDLSAATQNQIIKFYRVFDLYDEAWESKDTPKTKELESQMEELDAKIVNDINAYKATQSIPKPAAVEPKPAAAVEPVAVEPKPTAAVEPAEPSKEDDEEKGDWMFRTFGI